MSIAHNTAIWRYMDLAKYVCLLEKGLYFSLPSTFEDPWEGAWAELDVREFRERRGGMNAEQMQAEWDAGFKNKLEILNKYGISAWHQSDVESAALWRLYMPLGMGVAIKSTVQRVIDALSDDGRDIICEEIKYKSYDNVELGDNAITLLTHKRPCFTHEQELRFLSSFDVMNLRP